jgi:hypothetical protein
VVSPTDRRGGFGRTASPAIEKRFAPSGLMPRKTVGMTQHEFEARIIEWARRQSDIVSLIQIGSRVQAAGAADALSDWDFHLISTTPEKYQRTGWVSEIAPPWCAHVERSRRGVMKVSAVFEEALEADFVLLTAWQIILVYWGMRRPGWSSWMPARLVRGIYETRTILLNSGYRVLVGGEDWARRLTALQTPWPPCRMSVEEFEDHVAAFWQKSVWVAKKIARPEPRSAMHWLHKLIVEHSYSLLEEEAWLAGRTARPEALKAEKWLDDRRLKQTDLTTSLDQRILAHGLLREIALFEEVSLVIAQARGFPAPQYKPVCAWLRSELAKIVA